MLKDLLLKVNRDELRKRLTRTGQFFADVQKVRELAAADVPLCQQIIDDLEVVRHDRFRMFYAGVVCLLHILAEEEAKDVPPLQQ